MQTQQKSADIFEHQCTRCAGRHRLTECTAPELPFPFDILGHPAIGVYVDVLGTHIGRP